MNLHGIDLNGLLRPVLLVDLHSFHDIQRVPAFEQPTEDSILSIQMRRGRKSEEELRSIGVRPFVRHGQDAARVVS